MYGKINRYWRNLVPIHSLAEKSSKSNNFGWLWWLLIPIVLFIMGLVYIAHQDKEKKELEKAWKRKLEEESIKALE